VKWFYNLKISKKLMLSFLIIAFVAGTLGCVGIFRMNTIVAADTKLYLENTLPFQYLNNVAVDFQIRRVDLKDMLLNQDLARQEKTLAAIALLDKDINDNMMQLDKHATNPELRQVYKDLQAALESYEPVKDDYIRLVKEKRIEEAKAVTTTGQGIKSAQAVEAALQNFTQTLCNQGEEKSVGNAELADFSVLSMLILIVVAVAMALILGWYVSQIISRPMQQMLEAADKLAVGDVKVNVDADRTDEIGILAQSFKAMIANISEKAQVAERIAAGDLRVQLLAKSEQDILASSMNLIIEALRNLLSETENLTRAALDGKLEARGELNKFSGSYQDIIKGVNGTLDVVVEPIREAAMVLQELAQGNLRVTMNGEYKGDFNEIKVALNNTLQSLNEVLGEINDAAEQVAAGSGQVAESSQALSQASTEQASSVQEITATMTEISTQTKQNALNANRANEMANNAKENAIQGNQEMQEMLEAMSEINESSSSISKIIKVIDEIAFQTNILALNAAVEAARAGQHGKGFAVVAEEVRNLAARSANAAKETTVMIEGSINKVALGTKMATGTAEALNKIMAGVSNVAELVGDIAAASNEQATAIAQVNQGISGIAEVTQMNTATSQESAAASEELASQAELLKDRVNRFKLAQHRSSLPKMEGISPEIIKFLENMSEKNKVSYPDQGDESRNLAKRPRVKISLDDASFGKY